ncbi:MAG: DUF4760 domain-containing protein [Frankiales bacterium]|nr:DUF4760 domain-containing protein [Frankiales bacterium]
MTTTAMPEISTDEIQIVRTPPTVNDAQLILQHQAVDAANGANAGFGILRQFESPPTMSQLRKKHPIGSDGWGQVMAFLGSNETTATFVRQGILNEALVHDLYWVAGAWASAEKICKALRREAGEPRLYENFEWLAKRVP